MGEEKDWLDPRHVIHATENMRRKSNKTSKKVSKKPATHPTGELVGHIHSLPCQPDGGITPYHRIGTLVRVRAKVVAQAPPLCGLDPVVFSPVFIVIETTQRVPVL